jgi:hypothetical protein
VRREKSQYCHLQCWSVFGVNFQIFALRPIRRADSWPSGNQALRDRRSRCHHCLQWSFAPRLIRDSFSTVEPEVPAMTLMWGCCPGVRRVQTNNRPPAGSDIRPGQVNAETSYPKMVITTSDLRLFAPIGSAWFCGAKAQTSVCSENSQEELWLALRVVHAHLFQ